MGFVISLDELLSLADALVLNSFESKHTGNAPGDQRRLFCAQLYTPVTTCTNILSIDEPQPPEVVVATLMG